MQKIKQDHIVGLLLLLLGIGAMILSMQITVKTGSTDPGSRLFPMLASILLTVCGAGVLLTAKKSKETKFLDQAGWKRLLVASGCMIAYILALKYIGFIISTPIFLWAMVTLFAEGKQVAIWKRIVYAVVVTAISWVVFQEMLSMALPGGVLF